MESLAHLLREAEPYVFQVSLGLVALFGLLKDWKDYDDASKTFWKPLRIVVLVATFCIILLSIFETYDTHRDAKLKEETASRNEVESKKQIEVLTEQVSLERDENKHNADGFRQSFDALYSKYSDLAAKVRNADLLREIKRTENELKVTQDKLNQPKARLTAGFWAAKENGLPTETTVPRRPDGSVVFDIVVQNSGDINALKGAFVIRLCSLCKFAKEPVGSTHAPGANEEDREIPFDHIFAHSDIQKYTIEAMPPPSVLGFSGCNFLRM